MKWIFLLSLLSLSANALDVPTRVVDAKQELDRLIKSQDLDQDKKITVLDKGSKVFYLKLDNEPPFEIKGTFYLSNLLQELKFMQDQKNDFLEFHSIFLNPVDRISHSIKNRYWKGLTRRIDADNLASVLVDPKVDADQKAYYLYIPETDPESLKYYKAAVLNSKLKVEFVTLPHAASPEFVKSINGKHGLLTLALRKNKEGKTEGVPYVVPGGRFNEMYGWDSYFIVLGLLNDGKWELARDMVDNFVYQINHYGKILNANRTYYLTRSQPPFLTSMIRAVYEASPKKDHDWLKTSMLAAFKEYQEVWMGKDRLTQTGLSRYYGFGLGIPPEVEKGHYKTILAPYAKKHNLSLEDFEQAYQSGKIKEPMLDEFFLHDRAVRESGHDTTYRWRVGKEDRCADFVTIDLNSLLLKTEIDLAYLTKDLIKDFPRTSEYFKQQALKRKRLMMKYLWNEDKKMFFDYNFQDKKQSAYVTATTFYSLWAYDEKFPELKLLTKAQTSSMIEQALKQLEMPGGLASTSEESLKQWGDPSHERQWEYPNGWAPHQMLAWRGLRNYGHFNAAERLTYKWLLMITKNAADYNGTIPEKFDVVKRSHAVFAEYGNVGTEFDYITYEGFGWMNASFQVGLKSLSPKTKKQLEELKEYTGSK